MGASRLGSRSRKKHARRNRRSRKMIRLSWVKGGGYEGVYVVLKSLTSSERNQRTQCNAKQSKKSNHSSDSQWERCKKESGEALRFSKFCSVPQPPGSFVSFPFARKGLPPNQPKNTLAMGAPPLPVTSTELRKPPTPPRAPSRCSHHLSRTFARLIFPIYGLGMEETLNSRPQPLPPLLLLAEQRRKEGPSVPRCQPSEPWKFYLKSNVYISLFGLPMPFDVCDNCTELLGGGSQHQVGGSSQSFTSLHGHANINVYVNVLATNANSELYRPSTFSVILTSNFAVHDLLNRLPSDRPLHLPILLSFQIELSGPSTLSIVLTSSAAEQNLSNRSLAQLISYCHHTFIKDLEHHTLELACLKPLFQFPQKLWYYLHMLQRSESRPPQHLNPTVREVWGDPSTSLHYILREAKAKSRTKSQPNLAQPENKAKIERSVPKAKMKGNAKQRSHDPFLHPFPGPSETMSDRRPVNEAMPIHNRLLSPYSRLVQEGKWVNVTDMSMAMKVWALGRRERSIRMTRQIDYAAKNKKWKKNPRRGALLPPHFVIAVRKFG
ncbi:uncharacterized protein BDR25DRAFT_360478 [Lindgomyces ingoldianus]|uniref:Uncharacterized protein n=1 Tax=Lindgomyces ingoldianus TaxID=673940 RepID=A0ACB6QF69_9PLEO|nr:uncharacterized protein BDR25DRAFT_360478 [Lindgomyces ingoldianus]KAF2465536.1 hypothetical protein BDR25DRAFT_360478 [Lindgomyces ingoldianus]